jgi:acyl-CoA synthetase (AMP-forming)/AMP-acid ligase II
MNLSYTLNAVARCAPSHPAITWDGGTITYGLFEQRVAQVAAALRARHGLAPGDRVAIWMENGPEFLLALYGAWRAGLAAVPVNSKLHPKEFAWIVGHSRAKLVIASPSLAEGLSGGEVRAPVIVAPGPDFDRLFGDAQIDDAPTEPRDEAWLFYTSGTTGRPKGAVLTHRNLLFACHAYYADIDALGLDDCMVHAAPLSHGSGLYALASIAKGGHQIIHTGFEPAAILAEFAARRNVSMFAAPTMVTRLTHHPLAGASDARGLKCIVYGGAPMYVADLVRAMDRFGPRFYQLYGQGESPMTITGLSRRMHADAYRSAPSHDVATLASAGMARTGVAFRIVGEDGRELPSGAVGEIVTRSDCVMTGYFDDAASNARALRDGWLWTGDLGSRDAAGLLTLKDRSKDMIISGGSNIYPREIEDVLLTHSGVLECAVVSRPHADWGEEVIAYVVRRPGDPSATAEALDKLCLDNIARFKRPKGYRFVEALPKNNYGKILKRELRDQLAAEPSA